MRAPLSPARPASSALSSGRSPVRSDSSRSSNSRPPLRSGRGCARLKAEFTLGLIWNLFVSTSAEPAGNVVCFKNRMICRSENLGAVNGKDDLLQNKRNGPDLHPALHENKALLGLLCSLRWLLSPAIQCGATDIRRYITHEPLRFCITMTTLE